MVAVTECKYCKDIPEYPKVNRLNADFGISIYNGMVSIINETTDLCVNSTEYVPITYCPICGRYISIPIIIYSDGAYRPVADQGGWGVVVTDGKKVLDTYYDGVLHTTNNQMELTALIKGLAYQWKHKLPFVTIFTDSQYVWGCATQGWKRNKNIELWNKYDKIIELFKQNNLSVDIKWVKGHADNEFNNKADELAVKGSKLWIA